jgi:hypothetical protein
MVDTSPASAMTSPSGLLLDYRLHMPARHLCLRGCNRLQMLDSLLLVPAVRPSSVLGEMQASFQAPNRRLCLLRSSKTHRRIEGRSKQKESREFRQHQRLQTHYQGGNRYLRPHM